MRRRRMYGIPEGSDGPTVTVTKASGGYVLLIRPQPKPKGPVPPDALAAKVIDMTAGQLVAAVRDVSGLGDFDPEPEAALHVCADLDAVMARLREQFDPDAAARAS